MSRNGTVYTLNTSNIGRAASNTTAFDGKNVEVTIAPIRPHTASFNKIKPLYNKRHSPEPEIQIRCLDVSKQQGLKEEPETFAIQSQSLQAEIVCAPSTMADLLQHVRDYPAFVESLLKQAQFCKQNAGLCERA